MCDAGVSVLYPVVCSCNENNNKCVMLESVCWILLCVHVMVTITSV